MRQAWLRPHAAQSAAQRSAAYDLSAVSNIDPARFILSNEQTDKCTKRKQRTADEQNPISSSDSSPHRSGAESTAPRAAPWRIGKRITVPVLCCRSAPHLVDRQVVFTHVEQVLRRPETYSVHPSLATNIAEHQPPHSAGKSSKRNGGRPTLMRSM